MSTNRNGEAPKKSNRLVIAIWVLVVVAAILFFTVR